MNEKPYDWLEQAHQLSRKVPADPPTWEDFQTMRALAGSLIEHLYQLKKLAATDPASSESSAPPSTPGPAIGPCPSCGASLVLRPPPLVKRFTTDELCDLWACGRGGTEVSIPKRILWQPTPSTSSGNEASELTPGQTALRRAAAVVAARAAEFSPSAADWQKMTEQLSAKHLAEEYRQAQREYEARLGQAKTWEGGGVVEGGCNYDD